METDAIIEGVDIKNPFEWLLDNGWAYLADYIYYADYSYYDELYRVLTGAISLRQFNQEYGQQFGEISTMEDAWKKYNKDFPKLMAQAMKDIADDILNGNIVVKFENYD